MLVVLYWCTCEQRLTREISNKLMKSDPMQLMQEYTSHPMLGLRKLAKEIYGAAQGNVKWQGNFTVARERSVCH